MADSEDVNIKVIPIVAYGQNILRKQCNLVEKYDTDLSEVINNLWNTLGMSGGVGLAAPQINDLNSVFIVNSKLLYEDISNSERGRLFSGDQGVSKTFINAKIIAESEETWNDAEACLSIPGITEFINRPREVIVEYQDEKFNLIREQYSGYTARVIQHEYDHIHGILFIDHLSALSKRLLRSQLNKIVNGQTETTYKIKYLKTK